MTGNHRDESTQSKTAVARPGGKDELQDTRSPDLPMAAPQVQQERDVMVTPIVSDGVKWEVTSWGKTKEKQLMTTAPIQPGEIILTERPLVFALKGEYPSGHSWALVDKIMSSTSLMEAYYAWRLKATKSVYDTADTKIEKELARKHRRPREMVRTLYYSVATNNITCFNSDEGFESYGLYRVLSRVNHSCEPNAQVGTLDARGQEMALIASKPIATGEAITWSYMGTNQKFLKGSYEERNLQLFNQYRFVCRCERCLADMPASLKTHPYLPRYFDDLLREEAIRTFRAGQRQAGT
jgi:hypothetical protein